MKNKILSIILVVALAAGVAGCGKNDSATADTSSQEASTEVPVVVEASTEEVQETTSSRQEQFEKDKEYLLSKGLTDFGWKDYWNHFIAIEDNDERLEFAATYDRFVSTHLEFKTFYYGLREKTVEVPDYITEAIEYEKTSHTYNADEYDDVYSWYTQSETPFDKWAESMILEGLKVHSKYYSDNLIDYEKNLSNIDIVNISDEEIIKLTIEDLNSIRRMYLEPQNSNIIMYYSEVGESMPYSFNESDYWNFEARYNQFITTELEEYENTHQLKTWHNEILARYLPFYAAKLGHADRGVPDDTEYTEEEFKNRVEELFEEDMNAYRTYFGLEPYKLADEWTRKYARQRAYEVEWTAAGPANGCPTFDFETLDLAHTRPFTDDDWNIIDSYESIRQIWYDKPNSWPVQWQGNTIWSKGRLAAWDHRNWPEKYHNHSRAENMSYCVYWVSEDDFKANMKGLEVRGLGWSEEEIQSIELLPRDDFAFNEYYAKVFEQTSFWGLIFEFDHYVQFVTDDYTHCAVGCNNFIEGKYTLAQEFYSLNDEIGGHVDDNRAYMFPEVMQAFYDDKIVGFLPSITTQEEADEFLHYWEYGPEESNTEDVFVTQEELEREREAELKALEEKNKELTNSSSNSSFYNNPYAVYNAEDEKTIDKLRAFIKENDLENKYYTMYSIWKNSYNDSKNDISEQEWLNRFGQYLTDDEF